VVIPHILLLAEELVNYGRVDSLMLSMRYPNRGFFRVSWGGMEKQIPARLLDRLEPEVRERLGAVSHSVSFVAGEQIFPQGAEPTAIYIVTSGQVKMARSTRQGHEIILCMPRAGDTFCPVAILDAGPHLGLAQAVTDVTLLSIEKADFLALCEKSPRLLSIVQGTCLGEVRRLAGRMELLAFSTLKQRLATVLLHHTRRQQVDCAPPDEIRMPQHELAAMAGASRESTSRLLAQWKRAGIVSLRRGVVTILRREELEDIAGG